MAGSPVRGSALAIPLADESVDLIVTSPPYWGLRSYRDGDEHYVGQVGDEASPQEFLQALWAVMRECWRVLKPSGSVFVNLGDKRAGSGGHNNSNIAKSLPELEVNDGSDGRPRRRGRSDKATRAPRMTATRRNAPDNYNKNAMAGSHELRAKSKMLLPHRFAMGCEDGLADPCVVHLDAEGKTFDHEWGSHIDECRGIGWIVRQDLVWDKPNGMPESTDDRTRDGHEYWFHLTKEGDYYANIDAIREEVLKPDDRRHERTARRGSPTPGEAREKGGGYTSTNNPGGRLPSSVWRIATQPLTISDEVIEHYNLPRHFAAFPQEWPRRLISAFSPEGICTVCGDGRFPVYDREVTFDKARDQDHASEIAERGAAREVMSGGTAKSTLNGQTKRTLLGWACACTPRTSNRGKRGDWKEGTYHFDQWEPPDTRPAVVLDPFGGTGTTAGVADMLGRVGISLDLSFDYSRLAKWRLTRSGHFAKTEARMWAERQGELFA